MWLGQQHYKDTGNTAYNKPPAINIAALKYFEILWTCLCCGCGLFFFLMHGDLGPADREFFNVFFWSLHHTIIALCTVPRSNVSQLHMWHFWSILSRWLYTAWSKAKLWQETARTNLYIFFSESNTVLQLTGVATPKTSVNWLPTKITAVAGCSCAERQTPQAMQPCLDGSKWDSNKQILDSNFLLCWRWLLQNFGSILVAKRHCAMNEESPASITGTAINPQLSPAITVLNLTAPGASKPSYM